MRADILRQILCPSPTLAHVVAALRHVLAADPVKAEHAVGTVYGNAFRRLEQQYESAGSRGRQELFWP